MGALLQTQCVAPLSNRSCARADDRFQDGKQSDLYVRGLFFSVRVLILFVLWGRIKVVHSDARCSSEIKATPAHFSPCITFIYFLPKRVSLSLACKKVATKGMV